MGGPIRQGGIKMHHGREESRPWKVLESYEWVGEGVPRAGSCCERKIGTFDHVEGVMSFERRERLREKLLRTTYLIYCTRRTNFWPCFS